MIPRELSPYSSSPRLCLLAQAAIVALWQACTVSDPPSSRPVPWTDQSGSDAIAPTTPATSNKIEIPAGKFLSGTIPGTFHRQPQLEPSASTISLRAFAIESTPRLSSLEGAPLTSRKAATALCESVHGRLCTELEWERACKGPLGTPFSGGEDSHCIARGQDCRSGFGAQAMGFGLEWTRASPGSAQDSFVVRGGNVGGPDWTQRCAHRSVLSAESPIPQIGVRCCYGPLNTPKVAVPAPGTTFRTLDLPIDKLVALLKQNPRTSRLAKRAAYFDPRQAPPAVQREPSSGARGFLFTTQPLLWNPIGGATLLVVTGQSGSDTSFVLAYHAFNTDDFRLAASFVMQGERGPVALAYNGYIRPRLHFTSCWGCVGETGKVLYRSNDTVAILQQ